MRALIKLGRQGWSKPDNFFKAGCTKRQQLTNAETGLPGMPK